jgi:hypothetical protein
LAARRLFPWLDRDRTKGPMKSAAVDSRAPYFHLVLPPRSTVYDYFDLCDSLFFSSFMLVVAIGDRSFMEPWGKRWRS